MQFRTAYGERKRVTFETTGESLTHQSAKDECDINNIMKKWERTGIIDHQNRYQGEYGDFTNVPDNYQDSLNAVLQADEMFMTLPAKIRARFGNDPGAFLDFVSDPNNQEAIIEMGLATKKQLDKDVIDDPKPAPKPAPKDKKEEPKPAE
jgi:phage internal scaffolding protein